MFFVKEKKKRRKTIKCLPIQIPFVNNPQQIIYAHWVEIEGGGGWYYPPTEPELVSASAMMSLLLQKKNACKKRDITFDWEMYQFNWSWWYNANRYICVKENDGRQGDIFVIKMLLIVNKIIKYYDWWYNDRLKVETGTTAWQGCQAALTPWGWAHL